MDSGDRVIPIVEDDQGEGYKDLIEEYSRGLKEVMNIGDNALDYLIPKFPKQTRTADEVKRLLENRRGR